VKPASKPAKQAESQLTLSYRLRRGSDFDEFIGELEVKGST